MSNAIEFIETSIFTKQIKALATDDELRALQTELIAQPEKGDLIQGTGACEKFAWQLVSRGRVAARELSTF